MVNGCKPSGSSLLYAFLSIHLDLPGSSHCLTAELTVSETWPNIPKNIQSFREFMAWEIIILPSYQPCVSEFQYERGRFDLKTQNISTVGGRTEDSLFFFFWWRTEDSQEQRKQMKKWFSVQLNGWVDRARPWAGMRRYTWAESPAHTEQPTSHSELSDRWGSEKNSPSPYWVQDNRWMEAYVRLGSKACNVGPLELLPSTAQPNAVHRNKLNHKTRFLDPQHLKPV